METDIPEIGTAKKMQLSPALAKQLASEVAVELRQVVAAVELLDGGATVPFIARYRKEVTAGMDDVQLRLLESRLVYLRELMDRKQAVIKAIHQMGKLTPELAAKIEAAPTKQIVEDLYLPFKQKRKTKGQMAIDAGLQVLADKLFANCALLPEEEAKAFVLPAPKEAGEPDFSTPRLVLDGVRDILSEAWAMDAALLHSLREWFWAEALLASRKQTNAAPAANVTQADILKFQDYFDYAEKIATVPSHRALAVFRGRQLGILEARLMLVEELEEEREAARELESNLAANPSTKAASTAKPTKPAMSRPESMVAAHIGWKLPAAHPAKAPPRPGDAFMLRCVQWTWRVKLAMMMERDLFARLREGAESVAISIFSSNMRNLLMAAPAGEHVVLGLDPGIRTGVKCAVIDATGKLLETTTIYPHEPRKDWEGSLITLARLCEKYRVSLIAIGNGTASRETDKLCAELLQKIKAFDAKLALHKMVVSEAGASVYSASEYASQELPEIDVSLRGAVSIARRLQDPLAELVKIEPKAIGVGQYQHDLNQTELARTLTAVVEDCVNAVGVDLNTASVPLLARISGVSPGVAKSLVAHREKNGSFNNRQQLLAVSGIGHKTFEQCAGFLRIRGGSNPLDATGIHPESYEVVEKLLSFAKQPLSEIIGRPDAIKKIRSAQMAPNAAATLTLQEIWLELEKPSRDPRPNFQVAQSNDVSDIHEIKPGMLLFGTVSNVAAFGAFVDLGVHQDGLIHVSQMSEKFISDAREAVKTGDLVRVKVLEVDPLRKRISLTLRLNAATPAPNSNANNTKSHLGANAQTTRDERGRSFTNRGVNANAAAEKMPGSMAAAFEKLRPPKPNAL